MNSVRMLTLLALIAMPAMAQKVSFEAGTAAVIGTGDLNRMVRTGNLVGYTFGGAVVIEPSAGLGHRFHLDLMSIRGLDGTGLESSSPKHLQFGYDVLFQATEKVSVFGGFIGMKWKQDEAKAILPDYTDLGNRNNLGKGTKLGARIGLEYSYSKNWKGVLGFTQTEFNKKYQPSWISLGLTYRFN